MVSACAAAGCRSQNAFMVTGFREEVARLGKGIEGAQGERAACFCG